MKNKRGLSPVIATVLLIAIVIAMALIIFLWVRGLVGESITKLEGENIKLTCDKVKFSADYSEGKLLISNDGNVPIYSLLIDVVYNGRHEAKEITKINTPDLWITGGLKQGDTYSGDISFYVGEDAKKIKVIPILIGNSKSGKKTYICEKSKSIKEISL